MTTNRVFSLATFPAHLGLGARVHREPAFSGMEWYERYEARHASDGVEGRLVAMHTFDAPWPSWEMHPHGDELVVCIAGEITLHLEIAGTVETHVLRVGDAIVNPPGVWHTADVDAPATAIFVTAGLGTENRPR